MITEDIKNSPEFIVSNEILFQEGAFTIEDIVKKVAEILVDKFFETVEQLKLFIKNKVASLCEIGLVSDTGLFYYVTSK